MKKISTINNSTNIISSTAGFEHATLQRRMIAVTIDMLFITILLGPILDGINYLAFDGKSAYESLQAVINQHYYSNVTSEEVKDSLLTQSFIVRYIVAQLACFLVIASFVIGFWYAKGATFGKMLVKCKIVDAKTGQSPSLKQYVVRLLSYLPAIIVIFMIELRKDKRGLHDLLAGTTVVVAKSKRLIGKSIKRCN